MNRIEQGAIKGIDNHVRGLDVRGLQLRVFQSGLNWTITINPPLLLYHSKSYVILKPSVKGEMSKKLFLLSFMMPVYLWKKVIWFDEF